MKSLIEIIPSFKSWISYFIAILIGAAILCVFSTLQKNFLGVPLMLKSFFVPSLFGGFSGFLVWLWYTRLQKTREALQQAHDELEFKVRERTEELGKALKDLQSAMARVKTLSGLLPICSICKKIRDDKGYWRQIESYIQEHSDAEFTHSICRECAEKFYPELNIYDKVNVSDTRKLKTS